ncbi:NAD(P)H-binding protein [Novosphingobium capsulatum]|uniref:NAD(P)H-binding protein n=1 Tax=Novosphingobium capsulatum TaxID=13688 RepID=UPI000788D601|nr:NAD(P)H-binding protein [Novosphingobium capsulatum]WQD91792.1 NAD(P)H-binding protein [Novosphingobium capsulatum]
MSDPIRVLLVGATGLVGQAVLDAAAGRPGVRMVALGRRAAPLPAGAQMEQLVIAPEHWGDAVAQVRPDVIVLALGTTIAAVGGDRAAFRAVDHDLTLRCATAARQAGVGHAILVSSVGADPSARAFYLATKGEVERDVAALGFARLDVLRPGLLRGARQGAVRPAERLGMAVAPLVDWALMGDLSRYRSIPAASVGQAIVNLASAQATGYFVHEFRSIHSAARGTAYPGS